MTNNERYPTTTRQPDGASPSNTDYAWLKHVDDFPGIDPADITVVTHEHGQSYAYTVPPMPEAPNIAVVEEEEATVTEQEPDTEVVSIEKKDLEVRDRFYAAHSALDAGEQSKIGMVSEIATLLTSDSKETQTTAEMLAAQIEDSYETMVQVLTVLRDQALGRVGMIKFTREDHIKHNALQLRDFNQVTTSISTSLRTDVQKGLSELEQHIQNRQQAINKIEELSTEFELLGVAILSDLEEWQQYKDMVRNGEAIKQELEKDELFLRGKKHEEIDKNVKPFEMAIRNRFGIPMDTELPPHIQADVDDFTEKLDTPLLKALNTRLATLADTQDANRLQISENVRKKDEASAKALKHKIRKEEEIPALLAEQHSILQHETEVVAKKIEEDSHKVERDASSLFMVQSGHSAELMSGIEPTETVLPAIEARSSLHQSLERNSLPDLSVTFPQQMAIDAPIPPALLDPEDRKNGEPVYISEVAETFENTRNMQREYGKIAFMSKRRGLFRRGEKIEVNEVEHTKE